MGNDKVSLRGISDKQQLLLTRLVYLDFDIEKYEKIKLSGKKITISDLEELLCDPDNSYLGFSTTSEGKSFKLATQREIIQQLIEIKLGNLIVIDIEKKEGTPFKAIAFEDDFKGRGMAYNGTDFVKISQDIDDNLPLYIKESPELIEYAKIFFDKNKGIDNYLYGHAVGGNMAMHVYIENYECVSGVFTMNATVIERENNNIDSPKVQKALCNGEKSYYCRTRGAYVGEYDGVVDPYVYNVRYILSEKFSDSLLGNLISDCIMFEEVRDYLGEEISIYAEVKNISDNFIHILNSEGMVNNGCKPVPKRKNPNEVEKEESDVSRIIHDVVKKCKDTVVKVGGGIIDKISDIILNILEKKYKTLTDGTDHESDGVNEFKEQYKIDEIFWGEGLKLIQEEKENEVKKEKTLKKMITKEMMINIFKVGEDFTHFFYIILTNYVYIEYNVKDGKKKENPTYCAKYWKEGNKMSEIKVNNGNIEDALKRFKRQCARNGVLQEVRKREHYEKPSVKRKKKSEAARKRKF